MAWSIGANDVANAMGTSVGSGALTIRQAIVVAAILEFGGALLAGGHVTDTVRKGMLDMDLVALHPELLLYGMLASLAAAGTLLLTATFFGLPVSTTHSIVGAIVGFGAVGLGVDAVEWGKVAEILVSWATSPLLGGILAFLIFNLIRGIILDREDPMESARRYGPLFFFYVFFVIGMVTLFKGLKNLKLDFDFPEALALSAALGAVGAVLGWLFIRRVRVDPGGSDQKFRNVERVFVVLNILTACAVAFAHGSNDVANAIGPLAAVVHVANEADVRSQSPVALWMLGLGGLGIVLGLATWGYRVMETIGTKITQLTPSRGFAAQLSAATTIAFASQLGIPVSTSHILVGSVLGVGLARGIGALDLRVVGKIVISWVATLPIAAALSVFFFYFFKGLLSS
ncbi:MAG: inorganic phosphate transporter [Proteobacteria bacterium]|nr:inorganic phosphate transporter [Pseudomonadota bacterium]